MLKLSSFDNITDGKADRISAMAVTILSLACTTTFESSVTVTEVFSKDCFCCEGRCEVEGPVLRSFSMASAKELQL